MRERDYRESRLCRVLGNPTAYQILLLLMDGSRRKPTEIARIVERGLPTVCITLRLLRNVDLLRYEHAGRDTSYWLKYLGEARALVATLRHLVTRTSRRLRKDR
jgi:DNA-binding transcriptional ArsR family regulator